MTLQPLEREAVEQGDRYLAAYASVHSLLPDTDTTPVVGGHRSAAGRTPVIPAARLAHSSGGRRKAKRRRFGLGAQTAATA